MKIGRSGWLGLGGLVLAAVMGWAWADGGLRPLRPMAEPVSLPGVGQ